MVQLPRLGNLGIGPHFLWMVCDVLFEKRAYVCIVSGLAHFITTHGTSWRRVSGFSLGFEPGAGTRTAAGVKTVEKGDWIEDQLCANLGR